MCSALNRSHSGDQQVLTQLATRRSPPAPVSALLRPFGGAIAPAFLTLKIPFVLGLFVISLGALASRD